jgi:serine/threonine protein kinase
LDESIDIWSYGNNLYAVLTGLNPFYDLLHTNEVRKAVKDGKTAYIDPRWSNHSYPEKMIAEVIPKCWEYKPEDRMTIFELVTYFRDAMKEYKRLKAAGLEK